MIAKIAPIRRMPANLSILDYAIPENLSAKIQIGQLVSIQIKTTEIFGVICAIENSSKYENKTKPINGIIFETPAFTQPQLNFIIDISELYKASLGFLLQSGLLPLKKNKIKKISGINYKKTEQKNEQKKISFSLYKNKKERQDFYDSLKFNGQTLIIVPEIDQLEETKKIISQKTEIFSAETSEKDFFDLWLKVRSGDAKIIIGTRRALFLPWQDLRMIILDDEANSNHKSWDMAPRFHSKDAVKLLAHHHKAEVIFTGHTLSVEDYFLQKNENKNTNGKNIFSVVDMKEERKYGNYGAISKELFDSIKELNNGDVFLFVNKKGSSSAVGCRDCGYISKCEQCGRNLTYYQSKSALECNYCKTQKKFLGTCPKCKGANVAMYGAGTQLVENEIKKNINEYSVVRMDSETLDLLDFEKITGRKIIIGTQAAWNKIDWEKIEIVAFIDVDSQLLMPEFRIEEELFYNIRDARFKAKETAKIILQTNHKDYPFFEKIRDNSVFYEQELSARKDLFYPPFSYIIRVLFPADSAQISESEANFYLNKAKTLTLNDKRVIISGPIPMNPAYHDRKYWSTIIIKIPTEKKYEYVKQLAEWAPDESKFDPNPNSLLSF